MVTIFAIPDVFAIIFEKFPSNWVNIERFMNQPGVRNMTQARRPLRTARGIGAALVLCSGLIGSAVAQIYDFNRMVSGGGGGGGTDPEKRRIVAARGQYICLDVRQRSSSEIVFTIWSMIPEPNASLQRINLDTGARQPNLISNLTVTFKSAGMNPKVSVTGGSGNRFEVFLPYEYSKRIQNSGGLKQGNVIVLSATLGAGKTFVDVVNALHEGLNPNAGNQGLRIWVSGHSFLGGPPPGVPTISDDATFELRGPAPQCQRQ